VKVCQLSELCGDRHFSAQSLQDGRDARIRG
jgi:hypothetical protein